MKFVIVLLVLFGLGCNNQPIPNPTDALVSEQKEKPSFYIHLEGDSFFYKNKKIERNEIKELFLKTKNNSKINRKPVIGIKPAKNTKTENVVFLLELGRQKGIDIILKPEN